MTVQNDDEEREDRPRSGIDRMTEDERSVIPYVAEGLLEVDEVLNTLEGAPNGGLPGSLRSLMPPARSESTPCMDEGPLQGIKMMIMEEIII